GVAKGGDDVAQAVGIERLADVVEHQDLACNQGNGSVQGRGLAPVRDAQKAHSLAGKAARDFIGAVGRAVGNHQDVHQVAGIVQAQDRLQLALQKLLSVVNGDHKRNGAKFVVLVNGIVGAP